MFVKRPLAKRLVGETTGFHMNGSVQHVNCLYIARDNTDLHRLALQLFPSAAIAQSPDNVVNDQAGCAKVSYPQSRTPISSFLLHNKFIPDTDGERALMVALYHCFQNSKFHLCPV